MWLIIATHCHSSGMTQSFKTMLQKIWLQARDFKSHNDPEQFPIRKSTSSFVAVESSMGVVHSRPTCDNQDDQWHAAASRDLQLAGESSSMNIPPASNNDRQPLVSGT